MKKINFTVDFVAEVPDAVTEDDLQTLGIEVPPAACRVCDGAFNLPGASVIAHTTTDCWFDSE